MIKPTLVTASFILGLVGYHGPAAAMLSVPVPGAKFTKLFMFDGPGEFCPADMSIRLQAGEFVIARRKNSWSVDYQIELKEGRIKLHSTSAGSPSGKFVKKVGEGRLLKDKQLGKIFYSYDSGVRGQLLLSGFKLKSRTGKKLIKRIKFVASRGDKVGKEPCLPRTVIEE